MTLPGGGAGEERDPRAGAPGAPVAIAAAAPPADGLRVVASKSHLDPQTQAYLARIGPSRLASAGSSLKFCLLAAGEADLYPRFGPTMHWDTAAADAVLRAAGGRVLRLPDLAPMRYVGPDRRNPGFIATGRADPPPPA
jgi:3'(2'), 5'-bisphosphate nucleotidase